MWKRVGQGVKDGYTMVSDARRAVGLAVDDSPDVFLRPLSSVEVPYEGEEEEEEEPEGAPVVTPLELEAVI